MIKVFYYYYYLFYSKILKDDEPHLLTILALTASESFIVNGILDIILSRFFCMSLNKWPMLGVLVLLLTINLFYYHRKGKSKEIIKNKPMFSSNHKLSIIMTLLFFTISLSFIFFGPVYAKKIMEEYCF